MRQTWIVQQSSKWVEADASFSDLLMAVQLRPAFRLGVIAMPHAYIFQTDGFIQMFQRIDHASFTHNVVSRDVGMASVNAGGDGNYAVQSVEHFGDLFEASSERKFCSGSIFDQDGQVPFGQIQPLGRSRNRGRGLQQPSFTICAAKRSGMQNQIFSAKL